MKRFLALAVFLLVVAAPLAADHRHHRRHRHSHYSRFLDHVSVVVDTPYGYGYYQQGYRYPAPYVRSPYGYDSDYEHHHKRYYKKQKHYWKKHRRHHHGWRCGHGYDD